MKIFFNRNISTKILIGFGIILLLFGGVTLANIRSAAGIQNTSEYVKDIRYQNDQDVVRMVGLASVIEANILSAADSELTEQFVKVQAQSEEFNELLGSLKKSVHLSDKTRNRLLEVEALLPELLTAGEEMVTYAVEQEYVELLPARERYKDIAARFHQAGSQLRAASTESFTLQMESISAQVRRSVKLSVIILLVALACSILLVVTISRSITVPLKKAIRTIEKLSLGDTSGSIPAGKPVNCSSIKNCGKRDCPSYGIEDHCWVKSGSFAVVKHCPSAVAGKDCRDCNLYGVRSETEELGSIITSLSTNLHIKEEIALRIADKDLTVDVPIASEKDVLSIAMKNMADSLRQIISQVKSAGEEIASGAAQVSDASQTLSQGATEQATSLEEINSSMVEMASQTSTSAENAAEADKLAVNARMSADDGNKKMQEMVSAMAEIDKSSQSISKIIKAIDEIAFQTNLLALNAAVEAARAGKHGKGFAVVAEEVRNLAARSSQAAKETTELIESSVERTQNGSETANEAAAKLNEIVEAVSKVTDLVGDIASSANEQAQGISQVNEGLTQIDNITQRNTANAEESAAASEELSGQAANLRKLLTLFTLEEHGSHTDQLPAIKKGNDRPADFSKQYRIEDQSKGLGDESANIFSQDDFDFGKYGRKP
jgi:methyl-accepting chemotaxis protein